MGGLRHSGYLYECAGKVLDRSRSTVEYFAEKTLLVTGATGLIGSQIVRTFLVANDELGLGISLVLPVRNLEKAALLFGSCQNLSFVQWSLGDELEECGSPDYVIHAACSTSSRAFLEEPVETIRCIVDGTRELLNYAAGHCVSRFLFLSTMEVYGEVDGLVDETQLGCLDPMVVRNSYPEAKRLCECLVSSYAAEKNLSASVVRLAQTFGEGVSIEDARVFAEFGRSAIKGDDIVLLSDGSKRNGYLSVGDAVIALLRILANGESGKAYNAANDATYCSILEMANLVLEHFGNGSSKVRFGVDEARSASFRKSSNLQLDCSALKALGWAPADNLVAMYEAMLEGWEARSHE